MRLVRSVACALLLMMAITSPAAAELSADIGGSGNGIVLTNDVYGDAGGGGTPGYEYEVRRLACLDRQQDAEGDPLCFDPADCPDSPPDDAQNQWRMAEVSTRLAGTQDPWLITGTFCLNFAVIAPQVTPEMAREQFLQLLPVLDFGIEPELQSFVNVPVIVYADATREWEFPPVTLIGQAVQIRAVVTSYAWSFGGVEVTADWPGRPFADDCTRLPCEGYVQYPFAAPGSYDIGLTVTWTGQFAVNGGAWQDVPGVGTTTTPPVQVDVVEARPVLTDPYG